MTLTLVTTTSSSTADLYLTEDTPDTSDVQNDSVVPIPSEWLEQASTLRELKAGWDSEGAPALDPETITSALTLAVRLRDVIPQSPWFTPSPYGGAQVEWHRGRRRLAFEFVKPYVIRYLKWDSTQDIAEEDELSFYNLPAIEALARWYAR